MQIIVSDSKSNYINNNSKVNAFPELLVDVSLFHKGNLVYVFENEAIEMISDILLYYNHFNNDQDTAVLRMYRTEAINHWEESMTVTGFENKFILQLGEVCKFKIDSSTLWYILYSMALQSFELIKIYVDSLSQEFVVKTNKEISLIEKMYYLCISNKNSIKK